MKKRLKTAATLPRDMGRLECAALVRPGSPLHSRIVAAGDTAFHAPVWGIFSLDRCFSPETELRFGNGASLTLNRADLSAVILLEGLADAALDELFP